MVTAMTNLGRAMGRFDTRLTSVTPIPVGRSVVETPEQAHLRREVAEHGRLRAWSQMRPAKFAQARLDRLDRDQHRDTLSGWLDSGARNLLLTGLVGPGKSYAAHAIGNEAVRRGMSVASYGAAEYCAALRPGGKDPDRPARVFTRATEWDLMVLDDLGQESMSEWVREQMYQLIEARDGAGGRLIVTCNITSAEVRERYGASVLDRIEDRCMIVSFKGKSRRRPHSQW